MPVSFVDIRCGTGEIVYENFTRLVKNTQLRSILDIPGKV